MKFKEPKKGTPEYDKYLENYGINRLVRGKVVRLTPLENRKKNRKRSYKTIIISDPNQI